MVHIMTVTNNAIHLTKSMVKKKIIATGSLTIEGLNIPVNIHNIKKDFGVVRYAISPIGGYGIQHKENVKVEHWENDTYKEVYEPLTK